MKKRSAKTNRILIALVIAAYSVLVILLASIILEGVGTFIGVWLNRPVADSYMRRFYGDIEYKVLSSEFRNETEKFLGFDVSTRGYCYVCEVVSMDEGTHGTLAVGDVFTVKSYNFNIYYDEIYSEYACDKDLVEKVDAYLLEKFRGYFEGEAVESGIEVFGLYADILPPVGGFTSSDPGKNVKDLIESGMINANDIVLYVRGDNVDFDAYKKIISAVTGFYAEDGPGCDPLLIPKDLQIFYYYRNEEGEDVALYESQLTAAELKYTADMVQYSANMHYKMIPTEGESKKLTAYSVVRVVYIAVILAAVVGLSGVWTVKKVRKLYKEAKNIELNEEQEKSEGDDGQRSDC